MQREIMEKSGPRPEPNAGGQRSQMKSDAPAALTLEALNLTFERNLYFAGLGQGLFNWGVTWKPHRKYRNLAEVEEDLKFCRGGVEGDPGFTNLLARDFRVPAGSLADKMGCYPQGEVPGIRMGILGR
jgi:hypothetical protein